MMGLPLGFAQPLVLLGLLSLPVLWWLLRLIPPRPRRIEFPPTRLLFDIKPKEDTPSRTPWWLTLLRLTLATLVILAAAGPLWNPPIATTTGATPIALLIDDGFSAAASWDARVRTADDIDRARRGRQPRRRARPARRSRPRHLAADAGRGAGARSTRSSPSRMRSSASMRCRRSCRLLAATPEHGSHLAVRRRRSRPRLGIRRGLGQAAEGRPVSVVAGGLPTAHALAAADNAAGALTVKVLRATTGGNRGRHRSARSISRACRSAKPASPSRTASARPTPSSTCRSRSATTSPALEIPAERSAGAVQLLDKRWRRRTVGIVSGATAETAQPLLASTFYLGARAQSVRRRAAGRAPARPPKRCAASSSRTCR